MRTFLKAIAVLAIVLTAACHAQAAGDPKAAATLIIKNAKGERLAEYIIELPPLNLREQQLDGALTKVFLADSFPPETIGKTFSATLDAKGNFSANLAPNNADNNAFLAGKLQNNQITGKVTHSTFAGPRDLGSFTITWPTK